MSFRELAILLPCHSLEDFPQHHEGIAADGLLANWTALWHPALLATQEKGPAWHRADDPPEILTEKRLLIPAVSQQDLPEGFEERAMSQATQLIVGQTDRGEIVERLLGEIQQESEVDKELVADFFALGYCFLQIQLLTRQMRYSSNLDEAHFFQQVLAAARAAVSGNSETAGEKLAACFDLLAEERDHYYSVDAYLIDLTLLDSSVLTPASCPPWHSEFTGPVPRNLLATAEVLEQFSTIYPSTFELLRDSVADGRIGLVGGEYRERPLPLLSCESVLEELLRGRGAYQTLLGKTPETYGRRLFGLSPLLPQIIGRLGFVGALHFTLEDGVIPQGSQAKTRWEGCDGSAIDALARAPLDAARPESFLGFANRLGESMDMDHIATMTFAHWPGRASVWYEDLRRCARFGAALGRFVTIDEYFRETHMPGHSDRFTADGYVSPYLRQSVQGGSTNPISSTREYWEEESTRASLSGMKFLARALGQSEATPTEDVDSRPRVADGGAMGDGAVCDLQAEVDAAAHQFAASLPCSGKPEEGYLVLNPLSGARRIPLDVSSLGSLPARGRPVFAAACDGDQKWAIVDVPAMGFAWIAAGGANPAAHKAGPVLAEDRSRVDGTFQLRNEYFEATVDPETGALRSLKDYRHRINRLSQQVALRQATRKPVAHRDLDIEYSKMVAESVVVSRSNGVAGEIVSKGRLVSHQGESQGEFEQTYRVYRGCRTMEVEIRLSSLIELRPDPWNSYYAARLAWADEAAEVYRGVHELRQQTDSGRCETPNYIEIDTGSTRTAVLTGGLSHHRRVGHRMIDSLLVVGGETARHFRLGISVDPLSTLEQSRQLTAPITAIQRCDSPPAPTASGWLFHFDAKNVSVTSWEPLLEDGTVVGARIRILESMGRSVRTRLSSFLGIRAARKVDFRGESLGDCQVSAGKAQLDLAASEWTAFEFWWGK